MVGSQDAAALENGDARSRRATTGRHHRVTMPSAHHSVVAKARRYRTEPERVDIVADDPLVAIVHGLHADHTVRHTEQGLVCSCERFRRGEGVCAHVLVVEQRRSTSASNAAGAELGEALGRAIDESGGEHSAADTSRSHHVHVPSPANTDGLGTVSPEQR
jgi:hypothetical protein